MIRILHVVASLNINAGMMSVIMNYYRHLDREKIQFDFLYFDRMDQTHQAEIERLGGRTYYMPHRSFRPRDQRALRAFFEAHRGEYTAVHCHPIYAAEIVAREAKRSGIRHVIQHAHSTRFSEKRLSAIRNRILMQFVGAFATDFIICSPEAVRLFGRRIAKSGRAFYLHNAIELERYAFSPEQRAALRQELQIPESCLLAGTVGRLSPEKNQLFLIEVFREMHRLRPNSRLLLVGDGPERGALERKIRELGLSDCVTMTGKRRDIQAVLSGLDLFLMPSLFEGMPVSALEALTSGLPVVLSDSVTRAIETEATKYLPLSAGAAAWAAECCAFYDLRRGCDRSSYSELRQRGFDIHLEAEKLQAYYEALR